MIYGTSCGEGARVKFAGFYSFPSKFVVSKREDVGGYLVYSIFPRASSSLGDSLSPFRLVAVALQQGTCCSV